jgi:amino acid adenylation domain-containing protein
LECADLSAHSKEASNANNDMATNESIWQRKDNLSRLRSNLSPANLAALEKRLRGGLKKTHAAREAIPRRKQTNRVNVSFAQQGLWLIEQLQPGSSAYSILAAIRFNGPIDVRAMRASLNEIVRRHETLRTSFENVDGEPFQVIAESYEIPLPIIDFTSLPEESREDAARRVINEEARRPLELSEKSLLRVCLLRLTNHDHILSLAMHHIIGDALSMSVLIRELSALYDAFSKGQPSPLPELPIQYADFAVWQREQLQGEKLERQLSYWKRQLEGAPTVLQLPTDRSRPAKQSFRGRLELFDLSRVLTDKLKALCQQQGVTLYMTLLAAFKVLLSRYSGQKDIVVGSDSAGRYTAELEGLIGYFVNSLALRTDLSGDPTFRELLQRVKEVCLDAYAHQDLPFERVVEALKPERSLSYTPVFQVMFSIQPKPPSQPQQRSSNWNKLSLTGVRHDLETSKFDLSFTISETEETLLGVVEYCTDLYDAETILRMIGHFRNVLNTITTDPDLRLSALPLLTAGERNQLLREWSGAECALNWNHAPLCHQLFEAQALRHPDAVAVCYEDQQINYRELNERSNRLAHYLRSLGIGPEALVGIALPRSIDLIVAWIAVLKAGGAFLPLDPSYPPTRLAAMVDAGAVLLLTSDEVHTTLPAVTAPVVSMDEANRWSSCSTENPSLQVNDENLAYIIYTSGSTGRPKGVMISHAALAHYVPLIAERFALTHADRFLQFASSSFDVALEEIFPALATGAALVLCREGMSGLEFTRLLEEEQVTACELPTAFWHEWVRELATHEQMVPEQLRLVVVGGERNTFESIQHWRRASAGRARLMHVYGVTEATITTTVYDWSKDEQLVNNLLPLGSPLQNSEVYVLDERLEPVPVGVHGELYLGGSALGRGYHARADLTAERYVPHPFAAQGGQRLYRTGDVVRWLGTGAMEFLGRVDRQVKVRGFRIELSEIETALALCPGVTENVVLVREDQPGEKRLVAYAVVDEQARLNRAEIRKYLKSTLPEYMIPSHYVMLDHLPITTNGKVDHKALLPPEQCETRENHSGPQGEIDQDLSLSILSEHDPELAPCAAEEEMLAGIWCEVLRVKDVTLNDNFFDLGGHSLLAMPMTSRIRDLFGVEISPHTVFEAPTVTELAQQIMAARRERTGVKELPIAPVSREGRLPLSFAQERLWFIDQLQPGSTAYIIPAVVRLTGRLNVEALKASFNEIVRRHESLRTSFSAINGEPFQIIADTHEIDLPVIDLRALFEHTRAAEASRLATEELRQPFDLSQGPPLRVCMIRIAEEESLLLATMHHIISDDWSMRVLYSELFALYSAYLRGEESPFPDLPVQYPDYAVWQREHLQGEVLATQLSYWKEQLAGAPALLDLPTSHPRPNVQSTRGAAETFTLPPDLSDSLRQLSRREGVTLFMTLLAAFNVLLHKYSGQDDIVVGSPIAGRNRSEVEELIGFFVNTLALRTDLSGDPSFRGLLKKVREVCLGAYAHQDLPFETLVEELQPERSLSYNPIFQVMFELENLPPGSTRQADRTESEPLAPNRLETAIFEIVLSVKETRSGMDCVIEYSTDLFTSESIKAMAAHFQALLVQLTASPDSHLSQFSMLSAPERQLLLSGWSGAELRNLTPSPNADSSVLIHELFEQQVARTPDAIALSYEGFTFSYDELNRSANQLARLLVSRGAGAESLVVIALPRSPELIVALLATLKAGAAYLPLDPAYPPERLRLMLEDAGASLLLTSSELLPALPLTAAPIICLDAVRESCSTYDSDNLAVPITAEHLAYVIYTSGSTGNPKGVMISHGALARYAPVAAERFSLTPSDRFLQFASSSFDVAVEEIFPTLISGAQLVMCKEAPYDGDFTQFLEREGVTVCELPTAFWQAWMGELKTREQELPLRLRLVIVGGEKNTPQSVVQWRKVSDGRTRLLHVYGVTEATVTTSLYELGSGLVSAESEKIMPLGGLLSNSEVYVLDKQLEPVPAGVYGELYIGGSSLARGYRGKPETTAEKYVPHPFARQPGERLYRTGDVVKWLGSGLLEFAGRADGQVKVRGFRIELGEIEATIRRYPSVRDAAAKVIERDKDDQRIVLYIVFKEHARKPDSRHLRHYLKEKLPAYMVPSLFVTVEQLHLTPNGKIDRHALPQPDWTELDAQKVYVAPHGTTQLRLQMIWEEIFGIRPISVTDDFFELGGHSLLAVRLISTIHKHFGRDLPLSILFQGATIERLGDLLDRQETHSFTSPLVPINAGGSKRPLFCPHGVGGNVVSYLELAKQLGPDQPFYGLQTPLPEYESQFQSLEAMVARYVDEIRKIQPEGPYLLGGWSMGGVVAFEMANQLHKQGQEVGLLAVMDVRPPVEKSKADVMDFDLIKTSLQFTIESFDISLDLFASDWDHFKRLETDDRLRYIMEKAQAAKVLPKDVGFEQLRRVYNQININFRLLRDYTPEVYPGEITVFKAQNGEHENEVEDFRAAWAALSSRELRMHILPCTHFEMVNQPHVQQVAAFLQHYFEQVEQDAQPSEREQHESLVLV